MNGYQLDLGLRKLMVTHKNARVYIKMPTGEMIGIYQPFQSTVDTDLSDQRDPYLALRIDDANREPVTVTDLYESVQAVKRFENSDLFNQMSVSVLQDTGDLYGYPDELPVAALVPAFSLVARDNKDAVLCY